MGTHTHTHTNTHIHTNIQTRLHSCSANNCARAYLPILLGKTTQKIDYSHQLRVTPNWPTLSSSNERTKRNERTNGLISAHPTHTHTHTAALHYGCTWTTTTTPFVCLHHFIVLDTIQNVRFIHWSHWTNHTCH